MRLARIALQRRSSTNARLRHVKIGLSPSTQIDRTPPLLLFHVTVAPRASSAFLAKPPQSLFLAARSKNVLSIFLRDLPF